MGKVAGAALVGVVLAQHALQPVAPVVPAHTLGEGCHLSGNSVTKAAVSVLVGVVLAQHALQPVAAMVPANTVGEGCRLCGLTIGRRLPSVNGKSCCFSS